MTGAAAGKGYRATESKYKGGAREMYVTYDLEQRTRSGQGAIFPKVKRVYVAGDVKDWKRGIVRNKLGREVHGVQIEYEQTRKGYRPQGYAAHRGKTEYTAGAVSVGATAQRFAGVAVIPRGGAKRTFLHRSCRNAGEISGGTAAGPIDQTATPRRHTRFASWVDDDATVMGEDRGLRI
jgi:hypothetical protein